LILKSIDHKKIPFYWSNQRFTAQAAQQTDCLIRLRDYSEWIGLFDVDEFMTPLGRYSTLTSLLLDHHNFTFNSLHIKNLFYGHKEYTFTIDPNKLIFEQFNYSALAVTENARQKQIVRSGRVEFFNVHYVSMGVYNHSYVCNPKTEAKLAHFRRRQGKVSEQNTTTVYDPYFKQFIPTLKHNLLQHNIHFD